MKCGEKDNVLTHLNEMESIYQALSSRGASIPDDDYVDAIIRSVPQSYQNLLTSLLTIYDKMGHTITPAVIKSAIRKEYDAHQSSTSNHWGRNEEIALQADTRPRGRGHGCGRGRGRGGNRGSGNQRGGERTSEEKDLSKLTCFNCGGKGHKVVTCSTPKKPREDKRNDKGHREIAATADDGPEEAWMAILHEMSPTDDEGEDGDQYESEEIPLPNDETNLHVDDTPPGTMALITNEPRSDYPEAIEIYDSGCMKHTTSYRHCLSNF